MQDTGNLHPFRNDPVDYEILPDDERSDARSDIVPWAAHERKLSQCVDVLLDSQQEAGCSPTVLDRDIVPDFLQILAGTAAVEDLNHERDVLTFRPIRSRPRR